MGQRIDGLASFAIVKKGVASRPGAEPLQRLGRARENVWLAAKRRHLAPQADAVAEATIERVGISAIADLVVGRLAHGQRRWSSSRRCSPASRASSSWTSRRPG
jgi:hypothetical protein